MKFLPSRSAWLHLRFAFSWFLLPVFIFAISQAPHTDTVKAILLFFSWHFFIYPASNGYNSYFDKDEGSIALIKHPPKVDKSLYWLSLIFDLIGIILAFLAGIESGIAVIIYGLISKAYSHPAVRLKKHPLSSFLVVFFFQGAFVFYTTYAAVCGISISHLLANKTFIIGGFICSFLIGASYPLTQVYQHTEDKKRGDKTLSILLGIRGTFLFSALMFASGTALLFTYWKIVGQTYYSFAFQIFAMPVFLMFCVWFYRVYQDAKNANFMYMSLMTTLSGIMMLLYFLMVWLVGEIVPASA